MRFSARLAGFFRIRCHQRRARRAERASFSVFVSNLDFRGTRLRQIEERALTGPCGSGKEATREAQNRGRGYRGVAALARSGPGAARASLMSIFPQAWIQVFRPGAWHHVSGRCFPARTRGTRIAGRNVTLPGHWCHLVRIGEDLHDRLGSSPGVQNNRPDIRKTVARASLSTFIRRRLHHRVDRYGPADRGRSKRRNQRWIDFCGAQLSC